MPRQRRRPGSNIRDVEIDRLRNTHDPLLAIIIAIPIPIPRSRSLGRGQRDSVAPGVVDPRSPVRRRVIEEAVSVVVFVGVDIGVAAGGLVDFVELAVLPAAAGGVVGALAHAVAV